MLDKLKDRIDLSGYFSGNHAENAAKLEVIIKNSLDDELLHLGHWPEVESIHLKAGVAIHQKWVPWVLRDHYKGVTAARIYVLWVTERNNELWAMPSIYNGVKGPAFKLQQVDGYGKLRVYDMQYYPYVDILSPDDSKNTLTTRVTKVGGINVGYNVELYYDKDKHAILCTDVNAIPCVDVEEMDREREEYESYASADEFVDSLSSRMKDIQKCEGVNMIRRICQRLGDPISIKLKLYDKTKSHHNDMKLALYRIQQRTNISSDFIIELEVKEIEQKTSITWVGVWDKNHVNWLSKPESAISSQFDSVAGKRLIYDLLVEGLYKNYSRYEMHETEFEVTATANGDGGILLDDYSMFIPKTVHTVPLGVYDNPLLAAYDAEYVVNGDLIKINLAAKNNELLAKRIFISAAQYKYDAEENSIKKVDSEGFILLHNLFERDSNDLRTMFYHMLRTKRGTIKLPEQFRICTLPFRNLDKEFKINLSL